MKILLLSAYDAASHRYWRQGLVKAFPGYEWTVLSLPARHFSWRIRGNPLTWISQSKEELQQSFDLLIATSMVDLATLKGLVPALSKLPSMLYFHENQFHYPKSLHQHPSAEAMMVNLYGAMAADRLLFNSEFNRQTFLTGVDELMQKLPDGCPKALAEELGARSQILPVPLDQTALRACGAGRSDAESVLPRWNCREECGPNRAQINIAWAARWEYDKGPDRLLAVMREMERRGVDYRLCILGQEFRNSPQAFQTIKHEFDHRLAHCGFEPSREKYQAWLSSADIMLSTSIHEFQGLAVLEAVALGCIPVLPKRMSYPELVPLPFLYESCEEDIEREAKAAADLLEHHAQLLIEGRAEVPSVKRFFWSELKGSYEQVMIELVEGHSNNRPATIEW